MSRSTQVQVRSHGLRHGIGAVPLNAKALQETGTTSECGLPRGKATHRDSFVDNEPLSVDPSCRSEWNKVSGTGSSDNMRCKCAPRMKRGKVDVRKML